MKLDYLVQAEAVLNKCGRPQLPGGISCVGLPRGFMMNMVLNPGGANVFIKEIQGGNSAPWELRAISSDQTSNSLTGIRCQIQLPNGRFLFGGNGVDIGQFCSVGSYRWNHDPELRCEPGSKIQVTLTDTTSGGLAGPVAVNLLFEGAFLHFMKGGTAIPANQSLASALPRYFGNLNENILAPAWMDNEGIVTPPGFVDEYFMYSTADPADQPAISTWTLTAGAITTQPNPAPFEIQIDPGYTMFDRRILFDLQTTGSASAIILGKLRTGAGYVLNDNFIDIARYLNGAEFATNWRVKSADSVFIDASLGDMAGTGTVTLQVYLEGYRRRAA